MDPMWLQLNATRREQKMSIAKLGKLAGLSHYGVANVLSGGSGGTVRSLRKIAEVFDLTPVLQPSPTKSSDIETVGRTITRDWMAHLGYTPEQIAEGESERDHDLCDIENETWVCTDENDDSQHPIHDEMDDVAELVMFVLERAQPAPQRGPVT